MKMRIVLAAAAALLVSASTFAQEVAPPCVTGTLASYIALGSGGCMFNSALYRNFTYSVATTNTITPAQIIVTPVAIPISTAPFLGLNFSASWQATAGQTQVSSIGYNVVPFPPVAEPAPVAADLTLDLGGATVLGTIGGVTVKQTSTSSSSVSPTTSATLEVFYTCEVLQL